MTTMSAETMMTMVAHHRRLIRAPTPLTPPGIAQRLPDENVTFAGDDGSDFEVENEAIIRKILPM